MSEPYPIRIGPYLIDPVTGWVSCDGQRRRIDRRALEVLRLLAREQGRVVTREEILATVWQQRHVSDDVLAKAVSTLRRALSDRHGDPRFIQTIRGEGYRLLTPVETQTPEPTKAHVECRACRWGTAAATAVLALALGSLMPDPPRESPATHASAMAGGTVVSNSVVSNFQPSWSPDGRRIAFVSDRDGSNEIYLRGVDGSELRRLTFTAHQEQDPSWSPDGRRLAYTSAIGAEWDVFVLDLETGTTSRLTHHGAADFSPQFSPDGSTIVFTSTRDGNAELYAVDTDGSRPRNLTRHPGRDVGKVSFSPDGTQIAFASDRDADGRWAIYVMDRHGGGTTRLTYGESDASCPRWSPDGNLLVYNASSAGDSDILALDLRGQVVRPLLADSRSLHLPSWSPDGTRLAFHVKSAGGRDVYMLDLARRTETRLTCGLAGAACGPV